MKDTFKNLCFEGWEMIKRNKRGAGVRILFEIFELYDILHFPPCFLALIAQLRHHNWKLTLVLCCVLFQILFIHSLNILGTNEWIHKVDTLILQLYLHLSI